MILSITSGSLTVVLWRGFYVEDFGFPLQNTFSVFMWFASLYSNFHFALLILVAIWILANHLYWTLIVSLAHKWISHKIGYLRSKYMPSVLDSIFSICSWFFFLISTRKLFHSNQYAIKSKLVLSYQQMKISLQKFLG